jgi:hypothetical protein
MDAGSADDELENQRTVAIDLGATTPAGEIDVPFSLAPDPADASSPKSSGAGWRRFGFGVVAGLAVGAAIYAWSPGASPAPVSLNVARLESLPSWAYAGPTDSTEGLIFGRSARESLEALARRIDSHSRKGLGADSHDAIERAADAQGIDLNGDGAPDALCIDSQGLVVFVDGQSGRIAARLYAPPPDLERPRRWDFPEDRLTLTYFSASGDAYEISWGLVAASASHQRMLRELWRERIEP